VLVEGNKIAKIAKSVPAPFGAKVIDAGNRVLMPGLIDTHQHLNQGGLTPHHEARYWPFFEG
jgi:imidazolonepropionase-like amidohydrolase